MPHLEKLKKKRLYEVTAIIPTKDEYDTTVGRKTRFKAVMINFCSKLENSAD